MFDIAEVVPHAGRMILIDEIVRYDADMLVAQVRLGEGALFMDAHAEVPAWVGIEYMAQTIAAWAGVQARLCGQAVRQGYLLGTRRYTSQVDAFPLGDTLQIKVIRTYQSDEVGVFECQIFSAGELLVSASLNVYQAAH